MSRAQTVRLVLQIVGAVVGGILFLRLRFGTVVDALFAAVAFLVIGGIGERYFRKHATPAEIRADLEYRKDQPQKSRRSSRLRIPNHEARLRERSFQRRQL